MNVGAGFDYVIIGAGSAGSVIAARLAEARVGTICVLEAGPPDRNVFIHIPAGPVYTVNNRAINWKYQTEPDEGTAGRRIDQPRGKTLGGSGSINGHIYNRGQRQDFDTWAQMGNRGWSYADVLPYFKRSENRLGDGDETFRGRDGPFTVTDFDQHDTLSNAFIEGAVSIGIPRNRDYNGATQEGISYAQRSVHRGRRVSPARAYLHPAMKHEHLEVRTGAHVEGILFDGKRAVGVRYRRGGQVEEISARAEVILCGGAFNSPQLLQLAGIGSPDHLQSIGIDVLHALAGVGENFRDHYCAPLVVRIQGAETINERVRGLRLGKEILRYVFTRSGALALNPTLVYAFWKSTPALEHGDIQITFTPASYPLGQWVGLDKFPGATVQVWQQRPASVGSVQARSADPFEYPRIKANFLSDPGDQQVLVAAMRIGLEILRSTPFAPYVEHEIWPGSDKHSNEALLEHARQTGNSAYHPVGTCRMGPADHTNTVVDDQLLVHGIERLRIADASVMPTIPSANTNASSIMIGEKAADLILGRTPLPGVELS